MGSRGTPSQATDRLERGPVGRAPAAHGSSPLSTHRAVWVCRGGTTLTFAVVANVRTVITVKGENSGNNGQ